MRHAILASVFLAACGAPTALVPSHPAVARYNAPVDATRDAVQEVLAQRWQHVDPMGSDGFATPRECRTENGDGCAKHDAFTRGDDGASTFMFQLAARVVPNGGGAIVSVVATLAPSHAGGETRVYQVGKGEVPSWLQAEVDGVQAAIQHKLAPLRPNT